MKGWMKTVLLGRARSLSDSRLFHKVSLVTILAWVGLGSDGLSSSCYGPEETFKALGAHVALAPFVALACVGTIALICASYSQIIGAFPGGGGGYLVASKLLSPTAGAISGSALLVDYVLTIAISIASGADAIFSLLPPDLLHMKLPVALGATALLMFINLRGVKESVALWVPVFFLFLGTHAFAILYALCTHASDLPAVAASTKGDLHRSVAELGLGGVALLLLRAYSMGAGTFTGIEAVSNGLTILREPRVETGRRTMTYMGVSLAVTVYGLLLAYLLYRVMPQEGRTLNAVLFDTMTAHWPAALSHTFVSSAMISAALLLFIAAQAGFLDGPRVLANMALDRWFPARFANISDRFVTQNGIVLMGVAALVVLFFTRGKVGLLVVLYSINVFITFTLSQLGMVRHWWQQRRDERAWKKKLAINFSGFCLTGFILVTLTVEKFTEGGWVTLVVTGTVVAVAFLTRRHYRHAFAQLKRLNSLVDAVQLGTKHPPAQPLDAKDRTAVLLVNGFNGLGLHTLLNINRMFPGVYRNFVFIQVGIVDAGNFKGSAEIEHLQKHIAAEAQRYVDYVRGEGFHGEAVTGIGTDIVETAASLAREVRERYPHSVFFGGQLVFEHETYFTRLLHNFVVFALQRSLFRKGLPFFVIPIRV